ncbi:GNAT family N-acetyltransferase [Bacillus sp. JJ1521]|uniref:GNAT family N-acetyltransferase n=1 Tax=Bacillus sp. JJ1521 TaxID=3122957 RepID=UPI0030003CD7
MLQVVIHKQIDSLFEIMPEWEELKSGFHDITAFQDISWLKSCLKYESKQKDINPYIIEVRDQNQTIGIIPLHLVQETYARIPFRILKPIGTRVSDYLIPVLSKDYCPQKILSIAMKEIYKDKASWDCINWGSVPENSIFDSVLNMNIMKDFSSVERNKTYLCPFLILDKDIEKVDNSISKKFLKGVRYYERKLNREGVLKYTKVVSENEIEPVMNKLFELHCEKWGETDTPSAYRFEEERMFVLTAAKSLFERNLLHLSYLSHNDEIAAVEFGMADGVRRYLYLGTYNIKFRKYPIAHILLYKLIIEACNEGYEIMDFMRGNEPYKQRVATNLNHIIEYVFYNNSAKSLLFRSINHANTNKYFHLFMEKISNHSNQLR